MRKIFFVAACLLLATTFAMSQQKSARPGAPGATGAPSAKPEAQLIQMDKDWTAAELRGDAKAASMVVADDFWGTQPDGSIQNKTQYLADLKATKDTDVADEYSVRFFGPDVAVMTHRGTVTGEKPLQYRSTHVWVNRGGKWQIVAHHSSEVAAGTKQDPKLSAMDSAMPSAAAEEPVRKKP